MHRRPLRVRLVSLLIALAVAPPAFATKILFVGNSFTHGGTPYNAANITDLNGTGHGGVPGIFKKLADEGGFAAVDVSIEAVSGQTLQYHFENKRPLIDAAWDYVVLQDHSLRPLTLHASGNVPLFRQAVQDLAGLVEARNPAVRVMLYTTWARPDQVPSARYPTLRAMQDDLLGNYASAAEDFALHGWAPVGEAFMCALDQAVAHAPGSVPPGGFTLWGGDNYHANNHGLYLSALVFYARILRADPRLLPEGAGSAAAGLGIDAVRAARLQEVAEEATRPGFVAQPVSRVSFAGRSVRFAARANDGGVAYQWLRNGVPVPGATERVLELPSVGAGDAGLYRVRATHFPGDVVESAAATLTLATGSSARSWLIDLGSATAGYPTASPAADGRHWNNLSASGTGSTLPALVLADGTTHPTASSRVVSSFSGTNLDGPNNEAPGVPATARRDSFYVTGTGGTGTQKSGALRFLGLDPTASYDCTVFASRNNVSARTTRFTWGALAPAFVLAGNNSATPATLVGAAPAADDTLTLTVEPFDAAGVEQEYGYLNYMIVTERIPTAGAYELWASRRMLPEGASAPPDDPDGDGAPNLLEFALGRDPLAPEPSADGIAVAVDEANRLVLEARLAEEAEEAVVCVVEFSADLVTWRSGPEHSVVEAATPTLLRVRDSVALDAGGGRRFARLRVEPH